MVVRTRKSARLPPLLSLSFPWGKMETTAISGCGDDTEMKAGHTESWSMPGTHQECSCDYPGHMCSFRFEALNSRLWTLWVLIYKLLKWLRGKNRHLNSTGPRSLIWKPKLLLAISTYVAWQLETHNPTRVSNPQRVPPVSHMRSSSCCMC